MFVESTSGMSSRGCWLRVEPPPTLWRAWLQNANTMPGKRRQQTLSEYLRNVYVPRRLTLKFRSVAQIEVSVRSLVRFAKRTARLHEVRLDQLTNDLVCCWLSARLKTLSKATVKRDRVNVLAIWRDAMARGLCRRTVIDVPVIRVPRKVPRAVAVADLEKVLTAAAGFVPKRRRKMPACGSWANWWVALLLALYDSGARINALLSVRVSDVDLDGLTITLRGESAKTDLEQVLPISAQTAAAIAKVISGMMSGGVGRPTPSAMSGGVGRPTPSATRPTLSATRLLFDFPCARRAIWRKFKALAVTAGVDLLSGQAFHSIRKTNATLTTAFCSVEQAALTMGHTSTAMTWQRYVDPRLLRSLQSPSVNRLPRPVFVSAAGSGDPRRARQLCLFG